MKSIKVEKHQDYTYLLICPFTRKVRYVGWTSNTVSRYNTHLTSSKRGSNGNLLLSDWINLLGIYGYKPIMVVIEKGNKEWNYIMKYKEVDDIYNKAYSKHIEDIDNIPFYDELFRKQYEHFSNKFKANNKIN